METGYPQFGAYLNKWDTVINIIFIIVISVVMYIVTQTILSLVATLTSGTLLSTVIKLVSKKTSIINTLIDENLRTGRPMVYSCSWPAYQIGLTTYDFIGRNIFYIILMISMGMIMTMFMISRHH